MHLAKWIAAVALAVVSAHAQHFPRVLSILPSSGRGSLAHFEVGVDYDALTSVYVLIGDSIAPANSCMFGFDTYSLQYKLVSERGTEFATTRDGVLRNSRCRLLAADLKGMIGVSAKRSVDFTVAFSPAFTGPKKIWMLAATMFGDSGWIEKGVWNIPAESGPDLLNLNPPSALAQAGDFQAKFQHSGGPLRHYLSYILFLPTESPVQFTAAQSCLIEYNRISNRVRLVNSSGTGWLPVAGARLGSGGVQLDNTWCSVDTTRMSVEFEEEILKINGNVRFSDQPAPQLYATFLQAQDVNGRWTGMDQFGSWLVSGRNRSAGVAIANIASEYGDYLGDRFTIHVAATAPGAGIESLTMIHFLLADTPTRDAKCQIVFFPQSNTINLIDDSRSSMVAPVSSAVGSGSPISNSACTVDPARSWWVAGPQTAQLSLVVFPTGILGKTRGFAIAFDSRGYTTHWVQGLEY